MSFSLRASCSLSARNWFWFLMHLTRVCNPLHRSPDISESIVFSISHLAHYKINRPTIKRLALEHPQPIKQRSSCLNWDDGLNLPIRWHEVTWSQLLMSLISWVREPEIFASAKLYCQVVLKWFVLNKVCIRSSTFYVKAPYCLQYFIICYGKVQIKWVIFFLLILVSCN